MKNFIRLMILAISLYSCCNEEKYPITFSKGDVEFDKTGGNKVIVSLNDDWSFKDSLSIDYKTLYLPRCVEVFQNTEPPVYNPGTCSDSILTVKYDIMRKDLEPVQIEGSWFTISKKSLREISIVVSPNLTGKSRILWIRADIYGSAIFITQSAN